MSPAWTWVRSSSSGSSSKPSPAVTFVKAQAILEFHPLVEKEEPMQHRQRGRFETEQTNLFHPKPVRPAWETLALETRSEVTKLLARMLSAYQAPHAAAIDVEVQHD